MEIEYKTNRNSTLLILYINTMSLHIYYIKKKITSEINKKKPKTKL
jgi:hypothetical protein